MRVEMFTFLLAGAICLGGALGVVLFRNTVHNALSLVATLFGIAVLFIAQEAYFLAAVQVIVYAGAIVILFLFVIMLLGVDRATKLGVEPIAGQRVGGVLVGVAILGLSLVALLSGPEVVTGTPASTAALSAETPDVNQLGEVLFTDYVFAFEITAVLLTIAVVGAVVLVRRPKGSMIDLEEFPEGTAADQLAAEAAQRAAGEGPAEDTGDPEAGSGDGDGTPAEGADEDEEVAR
ncbi:MAG: NADH-quinone oxidoreductase subunit J [Microthrixaceae bacterium]|nr:NADH-quinone oxidoreductase subunit J [Microthrixaceae bacterium]